MTAFRPEQPLRGGALESVSEPLFAEAFENAPHAMALIAVDGSIRRANRSMCAMLGYTSGDLQRLNSADITHADDIETEAGQRRRLAAADIGRYELHQRYVRKDGENIWVRIAVSATRRCPGEPPCLIAQVESAEPRYSPDSGHTHDAWLARFSEATLAAIHEMGNCLTPLMMNTEMIIEQTRKGEIRESAHQIFKAARRIAFTLRRLRGVHHSQPVAYLGEERLLDLRLVAPPLPDRANEPTSEPPDAA